MRLLFDASSIYNGLLMKRVLPLFGETTLELARYELLNIIWKHSTLTKTITPEEAEELALYCIRTLDEMDVETINGYEERILKTAMQNRLAVYDSAYLSIALEKKCILVSEDLKQRKIAEKMGIISKSFEEIL